MTHAQALARTGFCGLENRFPLWLVAVGAVLLPCLFLPNLTTPLDFYDDGVIATIAARPGGDFFAQVWHATTSDFGYRGPFRPVMWTGWHIQAMAFSAAGALGSRLVLLAWSMAAAGAMLLLLRELRMAPLAALATTALALWNFKRSEIFMQLGLTENIAMPFALFAMVCAIRAARATRPLAWDALAILCAVLAIGTKNVFAAVVPAQILLRVAPDGTAILESLRRHWKPAAAMAATLPLPFAHLIALRMSWQPEQHKLAAPTFKVLGGILGGYAQALSLPFLGLGIALTVVALARSRSEADPQGWAGFAWRALVDVYRAHRAAFLAGALLIAGGTVVYLPVGGGGRYTMPGVWGFDLMFAALLTALMSAGPSFAKRAALASLAAGFVAVAAGALVKLDRFAARVRVMDDALRYVETAAPRESTIVWVHRADSADVANALGTHQGQHFRWHLHSRGRADLELEFYGAASDRKAGAPGKAPTIVLSGVAAPPPAFAGWGEPKEFARATWLSRENYRIYLWTQPAEKR